MGTKKETKEGRRKNGRSGWNGMDHLEEWNGRKRNSGASEWRMEWKEDDTRSGSESESEQGVAGERDAETKWIYPY